MVHIRPKGPVPVLALEWQISNEVPNNLAALKKAAERVTPEYVEVSSRETKAGRQAAVKTSMVSAWFVVLWVAMEANWPVLLCGIPELLVIVVEKWPRFGRTEGGMRWRSGRACTAGVYLSCASDEARVLNSLGGMLCCC